MGGIAAETVQRGGFWIRTIAYVVDAIILIVIYAIIAQLISDLVTLQSLNLLIGLVYFVYFWSATGGGQTPGMRVFGLRVVKTDGSALDYVRAFIRYVGLIISFIVFAIGVIWVAFDANKQGWHDKIAGTYVVKTR